MTQPNPFNGPLITRSEWDAKITEALKPHTEAFAQSEIQKILAQANQRANLPLKPPADTAATDFGHTEKPMVTREEYDRARAVLDALPPGVYIKCSGCEKWKRGGVVKMATSGVYCERCSK